MTIYETIVVIICVVSGMFVSDAVASPKPYEVDMDKIFDATSWEEINALPRKWQNSLTGTERRELIAHLIPKLASNRPCPATLPSNVVLLSRVDPKKLKADSLWGDVVIRQDIQTEQGRAAWVIEELLETDLPVRTRFDEEGAVAELMAIMKSIVLAMDYPNMLSGGDASPLEVRVAAASDTATRPRLLRFLVKDNAVEVRLSLAKNEQTPIDALQKLIADSNPEVRTAAMENLNHARVPKESRGR